MTPVVRWTGRQTLALRQARRMSIRAFAEHLGVAVGSVTNWEHRGDAIRLRGETQEILDRDLALAPPDVRQRFDADMAQAAPPPAAAVPVDPTWTRPDTGSGEHAEPRTASLADQRLRLRFALANPEHVDQVTAAYLREQVTALDLRYDRIPSATLLGEAGHWYGQITFLRDHASTVDVRRDLNLAVAESAILMGKLVWDASMRRDHRTALAYFDQAEHAAIAGNDTVSVTRAHLRRCYVALYGQKNPTAGLAIATRAAATSRPVSNVLTGMSLLYAAEAHAMLRRQRQCEQTLSAAESHFAKVTDSDPAAALFSPPDLPRVAGSCYLFLDDTTRAVRLLRDTLAILPGQSKAAAIAAANLALAQVRRRRVSDAVDSLHKAIDIVEATWGGGGLAVTFTVARALGPWRAVPAVGDVHDRLHTLLAA